MISPHFAHRNWQARLRHKEYYPGVQVAYGKDRNGGWRLFVLAPAASEAQTLQAEDYVHPLLWQSAFFVA